jgi:hypothetical protein
MQIMVMTVGAINKKDVNKLYQSSEKTTVDDLDKPIDLIRATRPIIIVDEPQSVDGGLNGAGKTALDAMHPCSPYAIQQHIFINIIWCTALMPLMLTTKNWSNRSRLPGLKSRMQATALM